MRDMHSRDMDRVRRQLEAKFRVTLNAKVQQCGAISHGVRS